MPLKTLLLLYTTSSLMNVGKTLGSTGTETSRTMGRSHLVSDWKLSCCSIHVRYAQQKAEGGIGMVS